MKIKQAVQLKVGAAKDAQITPILIDRLTLN
jgi:hypothetical protein